MDPASPTAPFSPWLRLAHLAHWQAGPGSGLGTRRHLRDFCFLLQVSGESWLWYREAGGSWPLRPGDLALVPPGVEYAWGVPVGSHLAIHFDLHAQPGLRSPDQVVITGEAIAPPPLRACPRLRLDLGGTRHDCLAVARPPSPARWRERFAPLLRQWARRDHERPERRLEAAGILAAAVADWLELARPAPPRSAGSDRRVGAVLDRLSQGPPPRGMDVSALARQAGVGETAFRAACLGITGLPPRTWLERRRMEHAGRLLRDTALPVAAVAAACGYPDPFHFARVFRRVNGVSPSGWR